MTPEALSAVSFHLVTSLLARLVNKNIFSHAEVADWLASSCKRLEESATGNTVVADEIAIFENLLKHYRDPTSH